MTWAELSPPAKRFRVVHAAWSIAGIASLGYLWVCALVRRRDPGLVAGITFLVVEGVALGIGGGDCPMAGRQREWGDPKPFFELVLPPRAAKVAVPILFGASATGLVAVALRPPRRRDMRRSNERREPGCAAHGERIRLPLAPSSNPPNENDERGATRNPGET